MRTIYLIAASLLLTSQLLIGACSGRGTKASNNNGDTRVTDKQLEGNIHAPEFPDNLQWLNTDHPLTLKQFQGKFVLLDFWTYCCINCMHIIPDLRRLEEKYPDELVVIGVHSAKFTNEKDSEAIRQAILRYDIKHPVVNDKDFQIWGEYAANAWPTLVLINPNGKIIGRHSGEGIFEPFDDILSRGIAYFDARGELKRGPLQFALEEHKQPNTVLSFPGKVKTDPASKRLFITDSNHDRIIITDPNGAILDVIGSGMQGAQDGDFESATFNHPQGTALDGDILYIADTENHLIRAANLSTRTVKTVLGTGKQARQYNIPGNGTTVAINSPWDLLVHDGKLYIAMAGSHQIWSADLKTFDAGPFAGSAREDRIDGSLASAALAQTSGLTTNGKKIYFADSETSSIREADFSPTGSVKTIVGEALFEYGDIDGPASKARLQHPLGIAYKDGLLYVADTYNSKIKVVDPAKRTSTTFAGTGKHGLADGDLKRAQFNEPGGVAVLGDTLYVADVNNHVIRVIDIDKKTVSTLQFSNLDKLAQKKMNIFSGRTINVPAQTIHAGAGTIRVSVALPHGYHLTEGAPFYIDYGSSNEKVLSFAKAPKDINGGKVTFPVDIPVNSTEGMSDLTLDAVIYYCADGSSVCMFDNVRLNIPLTISNTASETLPLTIQAKTAAM